MRILVAYEASGIVRDAFIVRGHDAVSCDILPTARPGPHIQDDVRPLLRKPWDMILAYPPCTFLTNARNPWKHRDEQWVENTHRGAEHFLACRDANAPKICIENPKMHELAASICGHPTCVVHPWEHGHPYTKMLLLWLWGLPPLFATDIVIPTQPWVDSDSRHGNRGLHRNPQKRAEMFPGVARAKALQWG